MVCRRFRPSLVALALFFSFAPFAQTFAGETGPLTWPEHVAKTQAARNCRTKKGRQVLSYSAGAAQIGTGALGAYWGAVLTGVVLDFPPFAIVTGAAALESVVFALDGVSRIVVTALGACPGIVAIDDLKVLLVYSGNFELKETLAKSTVAPEIQSALVANQSRLVDVIERLEESRLLGAAIR